MSITRRRAFPLAAALALVALPIEAAAASYGLRPFTLDFVDTDGNSDMVVDGDLDGTYDVTGRIVTDGSLGTLDPVTAILSAEIVATRRSDGLPIGLLVLPQPPTGDPILATDATLSATPFEIEAAFAPAAGSVEFATEDGSFGYRAAGGGIEAFFAVSAFGIDASTVLIPDADSGVIAGVPVPGALGMILTGLAALALAARSRA